MHHCCFCAPLLLLCITAALVQGTQTDNAYKLHAVSMMNNCYNHDSHVFSCENNNLFDFLHILSNQDLINFVLHPTHICMMYMTF